MSKLKSGIIITAYYSHILKSFLHLNISTFSHGSDCVKKQHFIRPLSLKTTSREYRRITVNTLVTNPLDYTTKIKLLKN